MKTKWRIIPQLSVMSTVFVLVLTLFSVLIYWQSRSTARKAQAETTVMLARLDSLDRLMSAFIQLGVERNIRFQAKNSKDVYSADVRILNQQTRIRKAFDDLSSSIRSGPERAAMQKLKLTLDECLRFSPEDSVASPVQLKTKEEAGLSQIVLMREYCLKDLNDIVDRKYRVFIGYILAGTLVLLVFTAALMYNMRIRFQAEAALRESQGLLSSIISNNPGAIYRCANDEQWTMSFISDAIRKITGYPPADFVNNSVRSYASIIHPDDITAMREAVRHALALKRPFEMEYRLLAADGTIHWVYERGHGIFSDAGVLQYLDGSLFDITAHKQAEAENKRLQDQMAQAQKLQSIGQLAGGVAHDFNNLLVPILGYSEMISGMTDPADPIHANAKFIMEAGERAANLTQQLLAFSRRQVLQVRPLDIAQEITTLGKMLRRLIRENIELKFNLDSGDGKVNADPTLFQQILMNLLINAQDAMPDGGTIRIETGKEWLSDDDAKGHPDVVPGEYAVIAVSDTGCGMTPEILQHIFEPFFTTKKVGKGTGLGLAMVYGNVKQHGGHVKVHSEPGKGSTFKIYLPLVEAETAVPEPQKEGEKRLTGSGLTVLVVEDHDLIREMTRSILAGNGFAVFDYPDPRRAIAFAEQYPGKIDLILSDVVMPEMNGPLMYETMKKMRPAAKILYMSGYTEDAIMHHGVLNQGIHFLAKPFTKQELLKKLQECLASEPGA